jgi:hypothetical protein
MTTMLRRRTLPLGLAGALLLAVASGCAEEENGEASAPASESSASAPASEEPASEEPAATDDDLAAGLLPAEAFGPAAQVVEVDVREEISTATSVLPEGATVTPAECTEGLGKIQPDAADVEAVAGQTAETPRTLTVELLLEDGTVEAGSATDFEDLLARCSRMDLTVPGGGSGTMELRSFEVPDVGDVSQGIAFTVTVAAPDGSAVTVNALMGLTVQDQRMLLLQQLAVDGAPLDEAAFADLFQQAHEAQADL